MHDEIAEPDPNPSDCARVKTPANALPYDVIAEIAHWADVCVLPSFFAACRAFRTVGAERLPWLRALAQVESQWGLNHPLAVAPQTDWAGTWSAPQLRRLFLQSMRVLRAWREPPPRQQPRAFSLFVDYKQVPHPDPVKLCSIPGAYFVVTSARGHLRCWRTGHGLPTLAASLEVPHLIMHSQVACVREEGRALIVGSIGPFFNQLVAICISYGEPDGPVDISHTVSPPMASRYQHNLFFFADPRVLGFRTQKLSAVWTMSESAPVHIVRQTPRPSGSSFVSSCVITDQHLYHFSAGDLSRDSAVQTFCLPEDFSAESALAASLETPQCATYDIPYPFAPSQSALYATGELRNTTWFAFQAFVPTHGVFAVSDRAFQVSGRNEDGSQTHFLHIWVTRPDPSPQSAEPFALDPAVYWYEHPDPVLNVAVGQSGTYVLLLCVPADLDVAAARHPEAHSYAGICRFDCAKRVWTFEKLNLGRWRLKNYVSIVLDDALGLIFAVDKFGWMDVIQYV
ncbi:unnamed protein product [Mycena citricolor]|uniref:Uncharacterized protein n=1 Tax=Mycena citricolor TaxID=2018698 RepID=A0AAD2HWR2_9AGAR|nr:unnamed protein product [Mycena citricolor]CAK5282153.1 unnamed protein product [Mycena citricolor]CAK5282165.1 unnamed protein product [Mycena citricolor]